MEMTAIIISAIAIVLSSIAIILSSVLLPAPFVPNKQNISPLLTSKDIP